MGDHLKNEEVDPQISQMIQMSEKAAPKSPALQGPHRVPLEFVGPPYFGGINLGSIDSRSWPGGRKTPHTTWHYPNRF